MCANIKTPTSKVIPGGCSPSKDGTSASLDVQRYAMVGNILRRPGFNLDGLVGRAPTRRAGGTNSNLCPGGIFSLFIISNIYVVSYIRGKECRIFEDIFK